MIRGEASFTGLKALEIRMNGGQTCNLLAERIFIDTGARPRVPSIPGLDEIRYFNSTTIMELAEVPEHLLIVGGGYVGVEFSQMFRRLGSQVTIVQLDEQLLTHEDGDVAHEVASIMEEDGVQVLLNTRPLRVTQAGNDGLEMTVQPPEPDGKRTLTGSHLLIAAGRVPNTAALNLEAAGIETDDQGHIVVDEKLETSTEGIYALGDVKGGPAFTHISYDDLRILRRNLLEDGESTVHDRPVPYTVFIDPQLGRVGLTEKQAQAQGLDYRLARLPMSAVARALEIDQPRGFMKALVDPETKQILGCAILAVQGGEIMAMLEVAMMGGLPYTALQEGVFTHPALAESLNNLFAGV